VRSKAFSVVVVLCALASYVSGQDAVSPARQEFLNAWMRRPVVLKKAMYSIAYDGPSGQAITVVSPDKGTFFQIELISHSDRGFRISAPILDRDPQTLLDKVSAQLGSSSTPKLLTFRTGTRLMAKARFIEEARDGRTQLAFDLYDDLNEKDQATILWVQWATAFSPDFTERRQVESLIGEFLATTPTR
jgi:hypothetical protein